MNREARVRQLQTLAEARDVDEHALNTLAIYVGSDFEGLALLVDAVEGSGNDLLARAATFALARAPWERATSRPALTAEP